MASIGKNARIYVAGHRGMVGSAIVRALQASGYTNLITRSHAELDLLDQSAVFGFLQQAQPDYVFIAAAKVGGIQANNVLRADFIYQNLVIEANLIHGAHLAGISSLCFLGSSCIYPRDCPQPIREEYLLTGPLEPTNEPYAIAKIAGIKLCESYNRQHGRRYVSTMPTNLYGPNDNYDLNNSHVLPALMRKVHLAKLGMEGNLDGIRRNEARYGRIPNELLEQLGCRRSEAGNIERSAQAAEDTLVVWGTGTPMREFLYVDDLASACIFLMEKGIGEGLYNIGTGTDVTIRQLAETIMAIVGFEGKIVFDSSKPDGTPRKLLDVSTLKKQGWSASTSLADGIAAAFAAYQKPLLV
jgi:GDP-L-fucose synthase